MLVDPGNRLVADTLEREWNDKLRILAGAQEERARALRQDRIALDDAVQERLIAAQRHSFKTVLARSGSAKPSNAKNCSPTLSRT